MATNISYNGNSLQTSSIITGDIDHLDLPVIDAKQYSLSHANSSAIPFYGYTSRVVKASGKLIGTSIANLDSVIDTFKGYLSGGQDLNLDIDYNGSTRRYIASINVVSIKRPTNLLVASFQIQFVCNQPFGRDTSTTTLLNATGRTSAAYTDSVTFGGTAPYQLPIITITPTLVQTTNTNLDTNSGFETDLTGYTAAGYGGTQTRVTTQHNSGSASAQIANAASLTSGYAGGFYYALSGLTVGQQYSVSCYVKGNAGSEAINLYSTTSNNEMANYAATTSWQLMTLTFIATGTTINVYFRSSTLSATWFIDDVTITAVGSASIQWGNANNGQQIVVTRTWAANDSLIIDCTTRSVTVNGTAVAFTGAFPEFPPGSQSISYSDGFTTRTFTENIVYTNTYL